LVDLRRQDEVPVENVHATNLVPLHDVHLATKWSVIHFVLDVVLWPGISVLTTTTGS
jgi:hypothetical protein